jgi:galactokinase
MIHLRAPGRICLFGEHQDYLGYPIIAMAISKYIYLKAERISENKLSINLPDIDDSLELPLGNKELEYNSKRDYLKSGYNQFIRRGYRFEKGYKIKITGDIPINAGASSSSALVMAWLYFLNLILGEPIYGRAELARLGYQAEVKEFDEAGGMMDHYSSTYGDLIYLEPGINKDGFFVEKLELEGFILGNSMEKKKTIEDLMKVKQMSLEAFSRIRETMKDFNQFTTSLEKIEEILPNLKEDYQKKIMGNIINRDITNEAKKLLFESFPFDFQQNSKSRMNFYRRLGDLLNMHHNQLMLNIGISTKKIDHMISKCLDAGAMGAKINGSGFGGTMFALAHEKEAEIKSAIETAGGEAFIIKTSRGVEET